MVNFERVFLEIIRKRFERVVEYYRNCVVFVYIGKGFLGK